MAQRSFMKGDYNAIYEDAKREFALQSLAVFQADAGRNQRLVGCLVGMNKRRQEEYIVVCLNVSRWCDAEITQKLLPIYTMGGRLFRRFTKEKNDAKISKLKRQMTYFNNTLIMWESIQEAAHVVIDAYHNQYNVLVNKGLAPELDADEMARRESGPTRIPVSDEKLSGLKRRKHASEDRAEKSRLERYEKPKSRQHLEQAFKASLLEEGDISSLEHSELYAEDKKKKSKKKPKVDKEKTKKKSE